MTHLEFQNNHSATHPRSGRRRSRSLASGCASYPVLLHPFALAVAVNVTVAVGISQNPVVQGVVAPLALVAGAIGISQNPVVRGVVAPLALVTGAIGKSEGPPAVLLVIAPFALVAVAIGKSEGPPGRASCHRAIRPRSGRHWPR